MLVRCCDWGSRCPFPSHRHGCFRAPAACEPPALTVRVSEQIAGTWPPAFPEAEVRPIFKGSFALSLFSRLGPFFPRGLGRKQRSLILSGQAGAWSSGEEGSPKILSSTVSLQIHTGPVQRASMTALPPCSEPRMRFAAFHPDLSKRRFPASGCHLILRNSLTLQLSRTFQNGDAGQDGVGGTHSRNPS